MQEVKGTELKAEGEGEGIDVGNGGRPKPGAAPVTRDMREKPTPCLKRGKSMGETRLH